MDRNIREANATYERSAEAGLGPKSASGGSKPMGLAPSSDKEVKFELNFETYDWSDMHWHAPANFIIYTDGSWTSYAERVAHNRRKSALVYYNLYVMAKFSKSRDGGVIYSKKYHLVQLRYDQGIDGFFVEGQDPGILEYMDDIRWINYYQGYDPN